MQHTKNYNFNLIETTDAFGPEALNANAEATERELLAARSELAALESVHAADKAELEAADAALAQADAADKAELQAAVQKAQATADAAYSPDQKPYFVGTYTGDGKASRTIEVGFRPSFLIVTGMKDAVSATKETSTYEQNGFTGGNALTGRVAFTDTGFTVAYSSTRYPQLNDKDRVYDYIAFR